MKERIVAIATLIAAGCLIDLGIFGVFADTAFRCNNSTIQAIALILVFIFPVFLIFGLNKKFTKFVASIAILVATLCMIYHFAIYGLHMITGYEIIITIGFIATVLILSRLIITK